MIKRMIKILTFSFGFLFYSLQVFGTVAQIVDLKCDYRDAPLSVDRSNPLLSWRLDGVRQGLAQTAYQIQAASSLTGLETPDLWDSGWVRGAKSTGVQYTGAAFVSKQRVYWRVRIKDETGAIMAWSEPTWFEGGLFVDSDWLGAKWISCTREIQDEYAPADVMGDWIAVKDAPQRAKELTYSHKFSLPNKLIVYAGAWWNHVETGSIDIKINGQKGASSTEGPPTVFFKDFSFFLKSRNEVVITLSEADISTPVSFGMRVIFADGSEQLIQSSTDWNVTLEGKEQTVKMVCAYGESPLGEAKISPRAPLPVAWYKKDFSVNKQVASARLYICGLGYNEPYINGHKVGDHVLDPGQMDYENLAHYQTFDVTGQLKPGDNTLSILLGDGWYNNDRMFSKSKYVYGKPGLRAYLDIRYVDGSSAKVISGKDWKWKASGIAMSSIFMGDDIDYRQWHSEWESPGACTNWKYVQEVKPLSPTLIAQDFPPIRVVREIEPIKIWQVGEKTWIVDLGQNISGWIGLDFNEPTGTEIRIRCTEMLTEKGDKLDNVPASFVSCHAAPQPHRIIADGKPRSWRPYFNYQGFRFAEIHGLSKAPSPREVRGLVVHTDTPVTATFKSSEPLLDRIYTMGIQTHLNNMHSILEDCPHREKCLWGGDAHSSWATGFYTLDAATFYRQQVRLFYTPPFDPKGIPGRIGVGRRSTNKTLDFTWSVSPLFLAWRNYQINGDLQTPQEFYDLILHFLKFTEKDSTKLMPNIHRYGDHAPPTIKRTPADSELIAGMNFFAAAKRFAVFAEKLGETADAQWSRGLAERIRKSIIDNYYNSETHSFGNGTHDSLALEFGVLGAGNRENLAATLVRTYQKNGKQFDGGFMSYFIYTQLTENGHVDLALEMLLNDDYPGIAQSIRDYDATTIYERYRDDSRTSQMRHSLAHHAMNHPTAWMLNYLAGIRIHTDEPGSRRLLLQPHIPKNLEWVEAEKETPYGTVKSAWRQKDGAVTWTFTIPPNSVAEVRLPVTENLYAQGNKVQSQKDIYELPAGNYELKWTHPK